MNWPSLNCKPRRPRSGSIAPSPDTNLHRAGGRFSRTTRVGGGPFDGFTAQVETDTHRPCSGDCFWTATDFLTPTGLAGVAAGGDSQHTGTPAPPSKPDGSQSLLNPSLQKSACRVLSYMSRRASEINELIEALDNRRSCPHLRSDGNGSPTIESIVLPRLLRPHDCPFRQYYLCLER